MRATRLLLMPPRQYYSARTGKNPSAARFELPILKRLLLALYNECTEKGYFQEMLGKDCVDDDGAPIGTAGSDVAAYVLRRVRKDGLWPFPERLAAYTEDDLFDMIEFLYDHVSAGVGGVFHQHGGCGMHYESFDRAAARVKYRAEVNELIGDYSSGYELSANGEIANLPEAGFANLMVAGLPSGDPANVDDRVKASIAKYLRRSSGLEDRRDAVRGLADVLEFLRPRLKNVLQTKDEGDLFNIANNFSVRHHNDRQQANYDPNIWTSWMFYFYLATIHAAQRLIQRAAQSSSGRAD